MAQECNSVNKMRILMYKTAVEVIYTRHVLYMYIHVI